MRGRCHSWSVGFRTFRARRSSGAPGFVALICAWAVCASPGAAQDAAPASAPTFGRYETWVGVDAAEHQWLAYSGITAAPFSADIYSKGSRVRLEGAYGGYSYQTWQATPVPCGIATCYIREAYRAKVERSYFDALLGYYFRLGGVTAKLFAGAAMSAHTHVTPDPSSPLDGTKFGGKAAIELWWNITPSAWSSLDMSYATTFDERSARWRGGWLLTPAFSIGPELRYDSNLGGGNEWTSKAGLFARYAWTRGEVSLAGGVAKMHSDTGPDISSAYGTLNVLFQY